ncbi:MAG: hypothetical protein O2931_15865 [Planctomycetota bacterium]|nr:hypothetical protein [Planctomycetota bacterium]MDA1180259.1 hypothetical protein [Planctomycetota bacterium]
MEPWERIERKIDRLTWLFVAYVLAHVGYQMVSWWSTIFWSTVFVLVIYVLLLTPFVRALFPGLGRRVLAFNRWFLRKAWNMMEK